MKLQKSAVLPETMREEIRTARLDRGWTHEALGARIGLDPSQVSGIETGDAVVPLDTLFELLRLLALDLVVVPRALVSSVESLVEYERDLEDDPPLYAVHGAEHDLWN